jgi:hypothetical protein
VHDAVTDRAHAVAVQVALGEIDQVFHPGLMVERRRPGMFTDRAASGVAGDEARGAPIQPIDLAREERRQIGQRMQRKLDARRAGIRHQRPATLALAVALAN